MFLDRRQPLRWLCIPTLAALLACTDSQQSDNPLSPPSLAPQQSGPSLAPAERASLSAALADARERLLPALPAGPATQQLADALTALAAEMDRTESAGLLRALARADAALERSIVAADPLEVSDLGAIQLVLVRTRAAVSSAARTDAP